MTSDCPAVYTVYCGVLVVGLFYKNKMNRLFNLRLVIKFSPPNFYGVGAVLLRHNPGRQENNVREEEDAEDTSRRPRTPLLSFCHTLFWNGHVILVVHTYKFAKWHSSRVNKDR